MSQLAIRVHGLSKQYRIGARQERYYTLRDSLTELASKCFGLFSRNGDAEKKLDVLIWALKNVTFEVEQGEVVGIIGPNGAGKTTLLKILSRITEPTKGRVELWGRVASLLEVGTGFHPELTGRENIYLSGAILGMRHEEIRRKFDEIIAFAGVETFADTPVKYYSSGMYLRLAFAVAAHLEPEILLVDEVLAVGDAEFQKKCLRKMGEVVRQGRTVLFVSHNLGAIREICPRAIWISAGSVVEDGLSAQVCSDYLISGQHVAGERDLTAVSLRPNWVPDSDFRWTKLKIRNSQGSITARINAREPFEIILSGIAERPISEVIFSFAVLGGSGAGYLFGSLQTDSDLPTSYPAGPLTFHIKFDPNLFGPGVITVDINAHGPRVRDRISGATIIYIDPSSDTMRPDQRGMFFCPCSWSVAELEEDKIHVCERQ